MSLRGGQGSVCHFLGLSACKHVGELETPLHRWLALFVVLFACSFEEHVPLYSSGSNISFCPQWRKNIIMGFRKGNKNIKHHFSLARTLGTKWLKIRIPIWGMWATLLLFIHHSCLFNCEVNNPASEFQDHWGNWSFKTSDQWQK